MRATLKVTTGPAAGTGIPVGDEPLVFGRGSKDANDLGGDPELSRRHARVSEVAGRLVIEDLGSTNGTFVNSHRIDEPTALKAGDSIGVGTTKLTVEGLPAPGVTAVRGSRPGVTAVRGSRPDTTAARPISGPVQPPAAAAVVELRVVAGRSAGSTISLGEEPVVIGRGETGETLSGDPELSRRHAKVSVVDGRVVVEDLGSANGTFVNGRRIPAPTVVEPGAAIWVGTTTLMIAEPGAAASDVMPVEPPAPSGESGLLNRFANLSDRRPGRVLAMIGVFFVIAVVIGAPVAGMLNANDPFNDPSSETVKTNDRIAKATGQLPGAQVIALITPKGGFRAAETRKEVERVAREIRREPQVTRTATFYDTGNRDFISRDRRSTYVAAFFKDIPDAKRDDAAKAIVDRVERAPEVLVGGNAVAGEQLGARVGMDLGKAEGLAFPILFALSLFVFRGVIAALLPLFVGALTVMTTFFVLRIVNEMVPLSVFALNIVVGLGLGLSIDYSLFVVSRYREELAKVGLRARGSSPTYGAIPRSEAGGTFASTESEALRRAMYTAGRTILYSAVTVAIALATLIVFPQPFMYSMGIGGAVCALVAVSVSLVALPALLAVLGPRINSLAPKRWARAAERTASQERSGPWYRLSQAVMKRPATVAALSAALLVGMGIPALGIKFTGVDASAIPKDLTSRKVDDALRTRFPTNPASEITVLVKSPRTQRAQVGRLAHTLRNLPGAIAKGQPPVALEGGYFEFGILPKARPLDEKTLDLVKRLRARDAPPVSVSGPTAAYIDQKKAISSRLPLVAFLLCATTAIVLFLMTGSLILPFKSLVMNALSLSAAFGLLVLIFQDGHLEGVLGYESLGALDISQPVLLFAVAFGLATDYAVFLLTRIKEARDAGASETDAVAIGLERTGRIVTQAALLFCVAIGAFATSSVIFIKELGVGTAFAVILDATIIRALLVPALMALLGARNWWAPGPLRRLHEKIGLSEG